MEIEMARHEQLSAEAGAFNFTQFVPFPVSAFHKADEDVARYFDTDWQNFVTRMPVPEDRSKSGPDLPAWRLRKIKAYVEEHLEERISTQFLADLVGLSTGYFCPAFKNAMGITPQAYVMQQRLKRAQHLLASATDLALNEIAFACGFTDQAHLNNRFKAAYGASPGTWRKAFSQPAGHVVSASSARRAS
ncbi:hypothetical protein AUP42_08875 [Thalassospira lucentensis]|uniref:HTH araC/xylS-type domain-containing protein n=2 Tax=Thalassospira lucentensis TaxID=168935 RepID=A0A154LBE4_9PROT|nr:hypothetical protein AUP42_08875 [Thalassospira lucentensis]